jgi:predicted ATPase
MHHQESLPMLSVFPLLIHRKTDNIYFLEAHLFPVSQKHIVSLMAIMYNHSMVITTHSPYILSAINNLILDTNKEELYKLVDMLIDVSAYTVEDGVLKSIVDTENRLIGMNIIDSVSDDFDRLLALGVADD